MKKNSKDQSKTEKPATAESSDGGGGDGWGDTDFA